MTIKRKVKKVLKEEDSALASAVAAAIAGAAANEDDEDAPQDEPLQPANELPQGLQNAPANDTVRVAPGVPVTQKPSVQPDVDQLEVPGTPQRLHDEDVGDADDDGVGGVLSPASGIEPTAQGVLDPSGNVAATDDEEDDEDDDEGPESQADEDVEDINDDEENDGDGEDEDDNEADDNKAFDDAIASAVGEGKLPDAFRKKARIVFEAAVASRVQREARKIRKHFQRKLKEQVKKARNGISEQVDGYLNFTVEQWVKDNQIALEQGARAELTESFLQGMRSLFAEHYVDIPASKVQVVEQLQAQIAQLNTQLNEALKKAQLNEQRADKMECEQVLSIVSEGLTKTDADKLKSLVDGLQYESRADFEAKVRVVRESYFGSTGQAPTKVGSPVSGTPVKAVAASKVMASYVKALDPDAE